MGETTSQVFSQSLDRLSQHQLLIISGKGGVGRTAVAVLLGLGLVKRNRRVLIATVGLDDRLAWMLGRRALTSHPQQTIPGLYIQRVVPQVCIQEYGQMVLRSERLSALVFDHPIVHKMLGAIPGLDDFAILGKLWHEACRARSFDTVIFDGPATGHLRYTLGIPQAILRTINKGPLVKEAQAMQKSLQDAKQVQAVLVGLPSLWPLTELGELANALREDLNIDIGAMIINGLWPAGLPDISSLVAREDVHVASQQVFAAVQTLHNQYQRQNASIAAWQEHSKACKQSLPTPLYIPWRWRGLTNLDDFNVLLAQCEQGIA